MLEPIYFISQGNHLLNIREALDAGCKLIQLRIKDQPEEHVHLQALQAKALCDAYHAKLIINDFPHIAKAISAYGIHVGLQDTPVSTVRQIVGNHIVIGGTANTFKQIQQRVAEGADYIGLGPYRFTRTKQKLSPILGLTGYQQILQQCRNANLQLPVVAIGGILPQDAPALFEAGVQTIALSGALINTTNKEDLVNSIINHSKQTYAPHRQ